MPRLLIVLALSLLFFGPCGGKKRPVTQPPRPPVAQPTIQPEPSPIVEPSPVATPVSTARATPYPTPEIDPTDYTVVIPSGPSVTVSGENLADKIQAAQDDPLIAIVQVAGGGSITKQVTIRKYTTFDDKEYSLDIQGITDYGAFLIANGVLVEGTCRPHPALVDYFEKGKGWDWKDPYLLKLQSLSDAELTAGCTRLLEPTYSAESGPAIIVFQSLGDSCCSHTEKAEKIAVVGFHVQGRQRVYDGGVRSTIQFGNCHGCVAAYNYLQDTGSIGISFGGSGLEKDHFSNNVAAYRNVFSGVAAANTATVNTENAYIFNNYVRRPGHHDPVFGGGVCGHDHETNSTADHTDNIWVYNNLYDYESAHIGSAGSAICLQVPYPGHDGKVFAVNNAAIGGRNDNQHRYMSNGLFLNKLTNCVIANNYVYRTGQNAIQSYGLTGCLIQDNDFESTGSSTLPSIWSSGSRDTIYRRNNWRERQWLAISVNAGIMDVCGERNVYEKNLTVGRETPAEKMCP